MTESETQQVRRHHRADLLVHGGTLLTPNGPERIDAACADRRIVALGNLQGRWAAENTLDATGLHVLPGVVDSQVHFREPGLTHKEDLESGTRGAVLGGVTSVFEMPNTNPLTLWEADLQAKLDAATGRAWCDYAFYIGGSGVNAESLPKLEQLPGCAGVKVFMGSSFGDLLADEDAVLRRILRHGHRRMAVHAEDEARRTIANGWIASRSGWTPYDGMTVTGWPIHTVIRGEVVVHNEQLLGEPQGKTIRFLETLRETNVGT